MPLSGSLSQRSLPPSFVVQATKPSSRADARIVQTRHINALRRGPLIEGFRGVDRPRRKPRLALPGGESREGKILRPSRGPSRRPLGPALHDRVVPAVPRPGGRQRELLVDQLEVLVGRDEGADLLLVLLALEAAGRIGEEA